MSQEKVVEALASLRTVEALVSLRTGLLETAELYDYTERVEKSLQAAVGSHGSCHGGHAEGSAQVAVDSHDPAVSGVDMPEASCGLGNVVPTWCEAEVEQEVEQEVQVPTPPVIKEEAQVATPPVTKKNVTDYGFIPECRRSDSLKAHVDSILSKTNCMKDETINGEGNMCEREIFDNTSEAQKVQQRALFEEVKTRRTQLMEEWNEVVCESEIDFLSNMSLDPTRLSRMKEKTEGLTCMMIDNCVTGWVKTGMHLTDCYYRCKERFNRMVTSGRYEGERQRDVMRRLKSYKEECQTIANVKDHLVEDGEGKKRRLEYVYKRVMRDQAEATQWTTNSQRMYSRMIVDTMQVIHKQMHRLSALGGPGCRLEAAEWEVREEKADCLVDMHAVKDQLTQMSEYDDYDLVAKGKGTANQMNRDILADSKARIWRCMGTWDKRESHTDCSSAMCVTNEITVSVDMKDKCALLIEEADALLKRIDCLTKSSYHTKVMHMHEANNPKSSKRKTPPSTALTSPKGRWYTKRRKKRSRIETIPIEHDLQERLGATGVCVLISHSSEDSSSDSDETAVESSLSPRSPSILVANSITSSAPGTVGVWRTADMPLINVSGVIVTTYENDTVLFQYTQEYMGDECDQKKKFTVRLTCSTAPTRAVDIYSLLDKEELYDEIENGHVELLAIISALEGWYVSHVNRACMLGEIAVHHLDMKNKRPASQLSPSFVYRAMDLLLDDLDWSTWTNSQLKKQLDAHLSAVCRTTCGTGQIGHGMPPSYAPEFADVVKRSYAPLRGIELGKSLSHSSLMLVCHDLRRLLRLLEQDSRRGHMVEKTDVFFALLAENFKVMNYVFKGHRGKSDELHQTVSRWHRYGDLLSECSVSTMHLIVKDYFILAVRLMRYYGYSNVYQPLAGGRALTSYECRKDM